MAEEFEGEGEAFEPDPEEDAAEPIPLPPEERESVEADLEDLAAMRGVFETQGAKGVVISCSDCGSNHYYAWDLLRESLEHMLDTGEPRMHEPAYQPREDDYVVWDYGKGYVDALADVGLESEPHVEVTACGWCESPLEPSFGFCPRCGRTVAVLRLYRDLVARGMSEQEVRTLMLRAGFEPLA
jgi:predicted nucleic-acid-binding Zn-ribbon protein